MSSTAMVSPSDSVLQRVVNTSNLHSHDVKTNDVLRADKHGFRLNPRVFANNYVNLNYFVTILTHNFTK